MTRDEHEVFDANRHPIGPIMPHPQAPETQNCLPFLAKYMLGEARITQHLYDFCKGAPIAPPIRWLRYRHPQASGARQQR
jgi:hypothetical protein